MLPFENISVHHASVLEIFSLHAEESIFLYRSVTFITKFKYLADKKAKPDKEKMTTPVTLTYSNGKQE